MATAVEGSNHGSETALDSTTSSDEPAETIASDNLQESVALKQLYEQSTQYKYWRYTQTSLDELRSKVNGEAIATIGENISEEREQRIAQDRSVENLPENPGFPTVEEELALLGFYDRKIAQIFRYWKLPSNVTATAIVYMKRFFLENTVMDYHPKSVMMTCMFLARKTENFLMTIDDFSTAIKSSRESILNLELLVCQSLRFQFTVHHPYRPCLGFFYDMQAVADNMEKLQKVYDIAAKLIDTSLYTDLCFLYQPAQIALAAMMIACKEESYVTYKFKSNEGTTQKYTETLLPILLDIERILNEDPRCKEVKKSVAAEIDKRLMFCEDPAKNSDSLIYGKRKRIELNVDDDDDDDDKNDERAEKRTKLDNDSSPE
ncbi:hypothetical protein BGZ65_008157 [Modicella reniformis]|uniref:Cyclin-like domain-containing protein n=1 Tax=Modicella reniformis TaxID=1440133 RepID=A0A9P6M3F4_9FUNG|nr:hypothetical protein BGZ65_008157 [Modicella reniformis]